MRSGAHLDRRFCRTVETPLLLSLTSMRRPAGPSPDDRGRPPAGSTARGPFGDEGVVSAFTGGRVFDHERDRRGHDRRTPGLDQWRKDAPGSTGLRLGGELADVLSENRVQGLIRRPTRSTAPAARETLPCFQRRSAGVLRGGRRPFRDRLPPESGCCAVPGESHEHRNIPEHGHRRQRADRRACAEPGFQKVPSRPPRPSREKRDTPTSPANKADPPEPSVGLEPTFLTMEVQRGHGGHSRASKGTEFPAI